MGLFLPAPAHALRALNSVENSGLEEQIASQLLRAEQPAPVAAAGLEEAIPEAVRKAADEVVNAWMQVGLDNQGGVSLLHNVRWPIGEPDQIEADMITKTGSPYLARTMGALAGAIRGEANLGPAALPPSMLVIRVRNRMARELLKNLRNRLGSKRFPDGVIEKARLASSGMNGLEPGGSFFDTQYGVEYKIYEIRDNVVLAHEILSPTTRATDDDSTRSFPLDAPETFSSEKGLIYVPPVAGLEEGEEMTPQEAVETLGLVITNKNRVNEVQVALHGFPSPDSQDARGSSQIIAGAPTSVWPKVQEVLSSLPKSAHLKVRKMDTVAAYGARYAIELVRESAPRLALFGAGLEEQEIIQGNAERILSEELREALSASRIRPSPDGFVSVWHVGVMIDTAGRILSFHPDGRFDGAENRSIQAGRAFGFIITITEDVEDGGRKFVLGSIVNDTTVPANVQRIIRESVKTADDRATELGGSGAGLEEGELSLDVEVSRLERDVLGDLMALGLLSQRIAQVEESGQLVPGSWLARQDQIALNLSRLGGQLEQVIHRLEMQVGGEHLQQVGLSADSTLERARVGGQIRGTGSRITGLRVLSDDVRDQLTLAARESLFRILRDPDLASTFPALMPLESEDVFILMASYFPYLGLVERVKAAGFARGEAWLVRTGVPAELGTKLRVFVAGAYADTIKKNLAGAESQGFVEFLAEWDPSAGLVIADSSFDREQRREYLAQGTGAFVEVDSQDVAERVTPGFLATLAGQGLLSGGTFLRLHSIIADDLSEAVLIFA